MSLSNGRLGPRLRQMVSLAVCLLMLAAVAVAKHGRVAGVDLGAGRTHETTGERGAGQIVVSTAELAKEARGFAGPTPVQIFITGGKVDSVRALPNQETPGFFKKVTSSGMLESWNGMTPRRGAELEVDAVSGATYSSKAVIANVRAGLRQAAQMPAVAAEGQPFEWSAALVCGLVVALCAAFLPLVVKSQLYRTVQLAADVVVLGWWCGSFVSYTSMADVMANGWAWGKILLIVVIAMALLFPLFGRPNHYCNWVCPLGAAQELAGKCVKRKVRLPARATKAVGYFRQALWGLLMLMLWTGMLGQWIDYELFTAFFWQEASPWVLAVAAAFLLMSFIYPRPFCRCICPVGTLLKAAQDKG